jgi:hypothetical protein
MSLRAQSFLGKEVTQIQDSCPSAILNLEQNIENQDQAITEVGYGPLNLDSPEPGFWENKSQLRRTDVIAAQSMLCGNCAAFDQSEKIMQCIYEQSNQNYSGNEELGYCQALNFMCTAQRTCDAWMPQKTFPVGYDPELDAPGIPYVIY